jgi:hypothetical protein
MHNLLAGAKFLLTMSESAHHPVLALTCLRIIVLAQLSYHVTQKTNYSWNWSPLDSLLESSRLLAKAGCSKEEDLRIQIQFNSTETWLLAQLMLPVSELAAHSQCTSSICRSLLYYETIYRNVGKARSYTLSSVSSWPLVAAFVDNYTSRPKNKKRIEL